MSSSKAKIFGQVVLVLIVTLALYAYLGAWRPLWLMHSKDPHKVVAAQMEQLAHDIDSQPEDYELKLLYAKRRAEFYAGVLDAKSKQYLAEVLLTAPKQISALNLLALDAFQTAEYAKAIVYWQMLLTQVAANSPTAESVQLAIAKAQSKLNPVAEVARSIVVSVDVAPELKATIPADAVLFVFAKATSGPPMPLAVVRQPVGQWPVQVSLTAAQAMMPELSIEKFDQVQVFARISNSGQALPQEGDLQAEAQVVDFSATPTADIQLLIK